MIETVPAIDGAFRNSRPRLGQPSIIQTDDGTKWLYGHALSAIFDGQRPFSTTSNFPPYLYCHSMLNVGIPAIGGDQQCYESELR
jgi:hypothetical protein